ncbi:MAG: heme o synthase [Burkholderiaceae bacterium]|jgi:protoheme IX farnesyltransferase|nr:protoheme IX farnesyltransferase [Burkholderiaceae bacterium]MBP6813960.1 heme o synthase [Burkholderiaceae bacterium]MBP7658421.1 heme o synthase [Burkholderiaceae bacterium]
MNTAAARSASRGASRLMRDVLSLFKLRIGFMIMITALVGMAVTPGPWPGVGPMIVLALSVIVSSAAAGAFNQYVDVESDRLMARTRGRAFVTGAVRRSPAWLVVMALMLTGACWAAWSVLNPMVALHTFLGAFVYGVVYTLWLKRRSWLNIVVGGLAGSFAVLAGAAAVDPALGPLPLLLSLVLFLWTPPHFWSLAIARQADYAAAGVPMLPVVVGPQRAAQAVLVSTVALVVASLLPGFFGAGPVYLAGAAAGGVYFIVKSWGLWLEPCRKTAMGAFSASLVQLSLVLVAATIDGLMR